MSQSASQTPGSKRAGKSMLVDAQSLTDKRPNHMTLAANEHAIAGHASATDVEAVEKGILNALFGDAAFMRSLEALTGLCVYRNAHTRYYCLQWFRMLRHSQGKPIKDISDAKCHLLALLRKGRKTRESFHRWHNDQLDPSRSSMIT